VSDRKGHCKDGYSAEAHDQNNFQALLASPRLHHQSISPGPYSASSPIVERFRANVQSQGPGAIGSRNGGEEELRRGSALAGQSVRFGGRLSRDTRPLVHRNRPDER